MENILFNKDKTKVAAKWGDYISNKGWIAIPTSIVRNQKKLNITSTELNRILVLLSFWWEESNLPFPSKKNMAEIIDCDISTIRRNIKSLEDKGLISREYRKLPLIDGKYKNQSNKYSFQGLINKLTEFELQEDFTKRYR